MLRQSLPEQLKELDQRCKTLLAELSSDEKVYAIRVAPEVKELIGVQQDLETLPELQGFEDYISESYIQSFHTDPDVQEIHNQIKSEILEHLPGDMGRQALSYEAASIEIALRQQKSAAETIEQLKKFMQQGIKSVLVAYYDQEKQKYDKEMEINQETIQETRRMLQDLKPNEKKYKKNKKRLLDFLGKLEKQRSTIIPADFEKKINGLLGEEKIFQNIFFDSTIDEELEKKLNAMSFIELVKCANKAMQATKLSGEFSSIMQKPILGNERVADYVSFDPKQLSLTKVAQKRVWLDLEERLLKYDEQLRELKAVKEQKVGGFRKISKDSDISAAVARIRKKIVLKKTGFINRAAREKEGSSSEWDKLSRCFETAKKAVQQLEENKRQLSGLINKQRALLEAICLQKKGSKKRDAILSKYYALVKQNKTDQEVAQDAMQRMEVLLARQPELYHGKLFRQLKRDYKDQLVPRYHQVLEEVRSLEVQEIDEVFEAIILSSCQTGIKACAALDVMKTYDTSIEQLAYQSHQALRKPAQVEDHKARLHATSPLNDELQQLAKVSPEKLPLVLDDLANVSKAIKMKREQLAKEDRLEWLDKDISERMQKVDRLFELIGSLPIQGRYEKFSKTQFTGFETNIVSIKEDVQLKHKKITEKLNALQEEVDKKLGVLNDWVGKDRSELCHRLMMLVKKVLDDDNLRGFWHKQLSFLSRIQFFGGATMDLKGQKLEHVVVPHGICEARKTSETMSEEGALNAMCSQAKVRAEGSGPGRSEATALWYSSLANLLEGNQVVLTKEKIDAFEHTLRHNALFNGLDLPPAPQVAPSLVA